MPALELIRSTPTLAHEMSGLRSTQRGGPKPRGEKPPLPDGARLFAFCWRRELIIVQQNSHVLRRSGKGRRFEQRQYRRLACHDGVEKAAHPGTLLITA